MPKLIENLKALGELINEKEPRTMDGLLELINNSKLISAYGYDVRIIRYMGSIQGVRVRVTAKTKRHYLPGEDEVYAVHQGLEKYIAAGWDVQD